MIRDAESLMFKTLGYNLSKLTGIPFTGPNGRIHIKLPPDDIYYPDGPNNTDSVFRSLPIINIDYYEDSKIILGSLDKASHKKNLIPTSPTGMVIEFKPQARISSPIAITVFGNSHRQVDQIINQIVMWSVSIGGLPLSGDVFEEYISIFPKYTTPRDFMNGRKLYERAVLLCVDGPIYSEATGYITSEVYARLYGEEGLMLDRPTTRRIEVVFDANGFIENFESVSQFVELPDRPTDRWFETVYGNSGIFILTEFV